MKRYWWEMATPEFDDDTSNWIVVLPVAAIEQHGPHLPVGVDAMIAEAMIERAAAALPDESPVTFLPIQHIGKSNEHVSFPGTLTLDWRTTIESWLDIGDSLARAGIRKFVMITSHGGNFSPMEIVGREMRNNHAMLAVSTSWEKLGRGREIHDNGDTYTDIHGGELETSLMLALRPQSVMMDKAENFSSAQTAMKNNHSQLGYHSSNANISWTAEDLNAQGPVGDATRASAEKGEENVTSMVAGFCQLMDEIAQTSPPKKPS